MNKDGYFVITRIHRDDLEAAGFDTTNVSDETMEELARKMCNDYLEQLYWYSMETLAELMGIPKKANPRNIVNKDGVDAICLELSDGTEVEVSEAWEIDDETNDSYSIVEIFNTENNRWLASYRGSLPDIDDEDFDCGKFIKKIEAEIDC